MLFLFFLVFFLISSVLFFFSVASVTESKSLYISRAAGNDAWSCDQWKPCKTISRAIKLATSGDQILLDGTGTDKDPYICLTGESQDPGIYIDESLSLIGSTTKMGRSASNVLLFIKSALKMALLSTTQQGMEKVEQFIFAHQGHPTRLFKAQLTIAIT